MAKDEACREAVSGISCSSLVFSCNGPAGRSDADAGLMPFQPDDVPVAIVFDPFTRVGRAVMRVDNTEVLPVLCPVDHCQRLESQALPLIEHVLENVVVHAAVTEEKAVMPGCFRDSRELSLEGFVTELVPDTLHRNDQIAEFKLYGHINPRTTDSYRNCFEPPA